MRCNRAGLGQYGPGMGVARCQPMLCTVNVASVARLLGLAERHGVDVSNASGLWQRTDADRVPTSTLYEVWEYAMRCTADPGLPIHLANTVRLDELGLLGFTALTADTLEAAVRAAARYYSLITTDGMWSVETVGDELVVRWHRDQPHRLGVRVSNESGMAHFIECTRQMSPDGLSIKQVRFSHDSPYDARAMRAFCECRVTYSACENTITLSRPEMAQRPALAQPHMHRYLCSLADDAIAQYSIPPPSFADRVRDEIRNLLADGDAAAKTVASKLGMSRRTLHRQLAEYGTTYRKEVDAVRRAQAFELVTNTRDSLTDIALDIGFAEPSSLSRAFREWFGVSPSVLRRAKRRS